MLREDFNEMCRVIQSKGYKNFYKYVIPKIVVNYADEGASTCTDMQAAYQSSGGGIKGIVAATMTGVQGTFSTA